MARWAVLLKPNVANILLFKFCEQKLVQHGPLTIAIDCNGLSLVIFEEKCHNYASEQNSAPNRDSFWVPFQCMHAGFLCPKCDNIASFLCIAAKIKISFIWKDDFFFAKIGIFCKSISGPLHSVVLAYAQPYSFGGRIKLIICQIRNELSVTIHEISTSWKKTLDGGPNTRSTSAISYLKECSKAS